MDEARKSAFFKHPARWLKTSLDRLVRTYTHLINHLEPWADLEPLPTSIPGSDGGVEERLPGALERVPLRTGKRRNVGSHLDTYA